MPNSIISVRQIPNDGTAFSAAVNRCGSLSELLELVPAPFRPRMQDLVNRVYRAAIKSNHARSYLSTLERHSQDGTFPPEIEGRIHTPMVQISKEYMASSECKAQSAARDTATRSHKQVMLQSILDGKRTEVAYLQSLFTENNYADETQLIAHDVTTDLAADAGVPPLDDGNPNASALPAWAKLDTETFMKNRNMFPSRAVALAFAAVQQEMSKKFKSLALKQRTDEDVEMQDSGSKSETVDALVTRKVEQLLKEYKTSQPGNGKPRKGNKSKPKTKNTSTRQTQKVTKSGQGKGKGKGGKKTPGKPRN